MGRDLKPLIPAQEAIITSHMVVYWKNLHHGQWEKRREEINREIQLGTIFQGQIPTNNKTQTLDLNGDSDPSL